jgi:transglutaminase-like putative cysteine protease
LLDTRNRESDVTEVVSPLVDIRSRLVNRGNVELLTVAMDGPHYLTLTALPQFTGKLWLPIEEDLRAADGTLSEAPAGSELLLQQFTIKKLGGDYAPAARAATSASWQGPTLLWGNKSSALYADGGLQRGYQYQVTSALTGDRSVSELRAATVDRAPSPIYYDLPPNVPSKVIDLAVELTAQAATPYDKAIALQNYFRDNFKYSTRVQSGASNDAMVNFLSIKKGYCEQFAGTFGAMARAAGLPTRVMVGFTWGQLRADGLYHIAGRHSHAWDEVWFDGIGWMTFDPTPTRGAPGSEEHTGVQAAQEEGNGTPGGANAGNTDTPTPTLGPSTQRPRPENEVPTGPTTPRNSIATSTSGGGSSGGWIIAALLLAIVAWVVAMPRVLNRWSRHRSKEPIERVTSAWAATVRSLTMAGAPRISGATPLEYARTVDVGRAETVEIARLVTRAVYSPRGVDSGAAERSELLRSEVDAACRARMSVITRLLDHLDPRSAWGRITG